MTLGEIMLRLKSPQAERLFQSPLLEATFGGGEANVAVSLALFGLEAALVTVLPGNQIGDAAIAELRRRGVDTSRIVSAAGNAWAFTPWKPGPTSAPRSSSTTATTLAWQRRALARSTGNPSSREPAGSTSAASRQR